MLIDMIFYAFLFFYSCYIVKRLYIWSIKQK